MAFSLGILERQAWALPACVAERGMGVGGAVSGTLFPRLCHLGLCYLQRGCTSEFLSRVKEHIQCYDFIFGRTEQKGLLFFTKSKAGQNLLTWRKDERGASFSFWDPRGRERGGTQNPLVTLSLMLEINKVWKHWHLVESEGCSGSGKAEPVSRARA